MYLVKSVYILRDARHDKYSILAGLRYTNASPWQPSGLLAEKLKCPSWHSEHLTPPTLALQLHCPWSLHSPVSVIPVCSQAQAAGTTYINFDITQTHALGTSVLEGSIFRKYCKIATCVFVCLFMYSSLIRCGQ